MSDDEILVLRAAPMFGHEPAEHEEHDVSDCYVCACDALADEALARGAALAYERNELDVLRVDASDLRERVAQLETALRDQANWIKSDGSGCWCANTSVCKNDPWCREARAALAATSR